jgi:hypothetical protein
MRTSRRTGSDSRRGILPSLAGVNLIEILEVTGWSESFAPRVRVRSVSDMSTWSALGELVAFRTQRSAALKDMALWCTSGRRGQLTTAWAARNPLTGLNS